MSLIVNRVQLVPLNGKIDDMVDRFVDAVAMLSGPYIRVTEKKYLEIFAAGNDFFQYGKKIVTFGVSGNGFALMPLQSKYADVVIASNKTKL